MRSAQMRSKEHRERGARGSLGIDGAQTYLMRLARRCSEIDMIMLMICAILLCASVIFGGGTRAGFLSDAALQMLSVPALLIILWSWRRIPTVETGSRVGLGLCAVIVLVPLLQLVPLPVGVMALLAPQATALEVQNLLGHNPAFRSLSAAPHITALSALSLLPPVTLFLGVLMLSGRERQTLSLVLVVLALVSVVLGLLQLAQGPASRLRIFEFTNIDDAVGFFANRNHLAALIYCALVFVVAAIPSTIAKSSQDQRSVGALNLPALSIAVAIGLAIVVFLSGQAMARSRAGIGLTLLALPLATFVALPSRRFVGGHWVRTMLLGALAVGALLIVEFAAFKAAERFSADPFADGRIPYARNTIAAAKAYMPFGSGMGTFPIVYPQFSQLSDESVSAFANRAHNDVLEIWLEAGLLAIGLTLTFLVWLVWRTIAVRRNAQAPSEQRAAGADTALAQASVIVIVLLLLHSLVDYPLRTGAMMAVFAFACAMIVPPPPLMLRIRPQATRRG
jgi:O-antigen ligase